MPTPSARASRPSPILLYSGPRRRAADTVHFAAITEARSPRDVVPAPCSGAPCSSAPVSGYAEALRTVRTAARSLRSIPSRATWQAPAPTPNRCAPRSRCRAEPAFARAWAIRLRQAIERYRRERQDSLLLRARAVRRLMLGPSRSSRPISMQLRLPLRRFPRLGHPHGTTDGTDARCDELVRTGELRSVARIDELG